MSFQAIKGAKVLVTGGAGFIGSNLCESLLTLNNEVVCLDNFATGRRSNIEAFLNNRSFKLVEGDIRDAKICSQAVKGCNIVLQQAALGSVPRSLKDPATTNDVNINGFLNVLIASRDAAVKRFVFAGSSSTYGDSQELPKTESVIGRPLSPYAVTKYANELYAQVFALNYDMEIIGLRYFNVFGRNQDPQGAYAAAIPKFIQQLIRHESPVINGDGSNSRDFTYIANVIQMNHLAATTNNHNALGQVFNTAVGERADLNRLVNLLKQLLAVYDPKIKDVPIKYAPERRGDIPHSLASIEKATKLLGYNPSHTLDQGLKETIDWYWEQLH
jgi:UDP-N-acetylglucosamine/UDP-N-acetylgalactosamine 4-epimerase